MNKGLRRLGQIVAALSLALSLALIGAAALALWQGGELLRATLQAQLQARLVPTVRLGEPLRWQLFPHPQVVVRDVSLTEASGTTVLTLVELKVVLDRTALTEGRVDIASVDVDGFELTLAGDAASGWDAAHWLRAAPDDAAPTPMAAIGRLRLVNGRIRVAGQIDADIADLELNVAPLRPGAQGEFTLGARVDVPSAAMDGVRIEAAGGFLADIDQPRLEHLKLEGSGQIGAWSVPSAMVQAARVEFAVEGGVRARDLTLDLAALSEAQGVRLEIEAALATLSGGAADWHGEALQVSARGEQASRIVAASVRAEQVLVDGAGWRLPELELEASSSGAAPAATLSLSGDVQLETGAGTPQLALMVRAAHGVVPHPADASATLALTWSGRARYDLVSGSAAGDLAGGVDQSRFEGRWVFDPQASEPLNFSATVDRLDLDRYLPAVEADAASTDALDLAPWRNWPVRAELRVGELKVRGFVSTEARLRLGGGFTGVP